MPKVNKLTEKEVVRLTPTQKQTLNRIQHDFCIPKSEFIRKAIEEKIIRDKKEMLIPKERVILPF